MSRGDGADFVLVSEVEEENQEVGESPFAEAWSEHSPLWQDKEEWEVYTRMSEKHANVYAYISGLEWK